MNNRVTAATQIEGRANEPGLKIRDPGANRCPPETAKRREYMMYTNRRPLLASSRSTVVTPHEFESCFAANVLLVQHRRRSPRFRAIRAPDFARTRDRRKMLVQGPHASICGSIQRMASGRWCIFFMALLRDQNNVDSPSSITIWPTPASESSAD